jgi:hypothetical protein
MVVGLMIGIAVPDGLSDLLADVQIALEPVAVAGGGE